MGIQFYFLILNWLQTLCVHILTMLDFNYLTINIGTMFKCGLIDAINHHGCSCMCVQVFCQPISISSRILVCTFVWAIEWKTKIAKHQTMNRHRLYTKLKLSNEYFLRLRQIHYESSRDVALILNFVRLHYDIAATPFGFLFLNLINVVLCTYENVNMKYT